MIYSVKINDNSNSPLFYLKDLQNFQNGKEYVFKPGVNIIIGENGCGKTTLLRLIESYLLINDNEVKTKKGLMKLQTKAFSDGFPSGVDVVADYTKNTFRFVHPGEYTDSKSEFGLQTFENFGALFTMKKSSTGESVIVAINNFFNFIFSSDAKLSIDYIKTIEDKIEDYKSIEMTKHVKFLEEYSDYIKRNTKVEDDEYTLIFDEPDRNLGLDNLDNISSFLSYRKEQTQVIATIHNPLLICSLAKNYPHINWVEMTEGYKDKIIQKVHKMID